MAKVKAPWLVHTHAYIAHICIHMYVHLSAGIWPSHAHLMRLQCTFQGVHTFYEATPTESCRRSLQGVYREIHI